MISATFVQFGNLIPELFLATAWAVRSNHLILLARLVVKNYHLLRLCSFKNLVIHTPFHCAAGNAFAGIFRFKTLRSRSRNFDTASFPTLPVLAALNVWGAQVGEGFSAASLGLLFPRMLMSPTLSLPRNVRVHTSISANDAWNLDIFGT